jgi:hypothetical protein
MRWAEHVARTGQKKGAYRILLQKLKKRLEDLGVHGKIILKRIFKK